MSCAKSFPDTSPRRPAENENAGGSHHRRSLCRMLTSALAQPFTLANSSMNDTSVLTSSTVTALYIETLIPPTSR